MRLSIITRICSSKRVLSADSKSTIVPHVISFSNPAQCSCNCLVFYLDPCILLVFMRSFRMWMGVKRSRYSSSSTSGERNCFYSFSYEFKAVLVSLFSSSTLSKTKKLRLASPFLSITIRLTFMDFFKKIISKRFYLKKYRTTLVILYAVWEGQCKEALVGVTAVGRMGWKLAASLFIYALAKQNPQLRWLASTGQLLYKTR